MITRSPDHPITRFADPLISVVIPSRQRPELLVPCVQSVLSQTWENLEIIVVLDGDTAGSADALRLHFPGEQRIRILESNSREGASVARNRGVQAATGSWIAFQDDDDLWFPEKLQKQMALALSSQFAEPVVTCQMLFHSGGVTGISPRHQPTRPMSEYLYVSPGFRGEQGLLSPQTVLAPRGLCLRVPFTPGLPRHEDGEWAMRISHELTVGFEFIAEPLVNYNSNPDGRERITEFRNWRYSLDFARSRSGLMTRKGYAGFILSRCVEAAAYCGEWKALKTIVAEAFRNGSPSAADLLRSAEICAYALKTRMLRRREQ
jgi:glycosyltransferase involved in cell wall biosynthesis